MHQTRPGSSLITSCWICDDAIYTFLLFPCSSGTPPTVTWGGKKESACWCLAMRKELIWSCLYREEMLQEAQQQQWIHWQGRQCQTYPSGVQSFQLRPLQRGVYHRWYSGMLHNCCSINWMITKGKMIVLLVFHTTKKWLNSLLIFTGCWGRLHRPPDAYPECQRDRLR